jgi:hypothetical protein
MIPLSSFPMLLSVQRIAARRRAYRRLPPPNRLAIHD